MRLYGSAGWAQFNWKCWVTDVIFFIIYFCIQQSLLNLFLLQSWVNLQRQWVTSSPVSECDTERWRFIYRKSVNHKQCWRSSDSKIFVFEIQSENIKFLHFHETQCVFSEINHHSEHLEYVQEVSPLRWCQYVLYVESEVTSTLHM